MMGFASLNSFYELRVKIAVDRMSAATCGSSPRIALRSIRATRYHDSFAERLPGLQRARRTHHRTAPVHFRSTLSKNAVARAIASAVAVAFAGLS
jgi:hypothetical protein